jgi:hypothetical protein
MKLRWICWLSERFVNLIEALFINSRSKKYEEILASLYLTALHLRQWHIHDLFLICFG